ncbi:MAG: arginine repressor [Clostridia bacterium]|nr:arginine repressor [Clostridia bacterium]
MKAVRHKLIKQIIRQEKIETQEELAEALKKSGFAVTQATVCRDIKELGLVKMPGEDGLAVYTLPVESPGLTGDERLRKVFFTSVLSVSSSENLLVVKTAPGEASGVAFAIDNCGWSEIIGTVAGDDTIIVVVKPLEKTAYLEARFKKLSGS